MFNPQLGVVNRIIESVFHVANGPDWFLDASLARIAILIVNLWLGYPYFMLITSGALQSIPNDIYEAAEVDGASPWMRFYNITLPLLLVSVGPLLIASFIFNFNNFNLIYAFVGGGPPIPTATTQAGLHGHSDQLCLQPCFWLTRHQLRLRLRDFTLCLCSRGGDVLAAIQVYEYVGGGWRKCLIRNQSNTLL